MEVFQNDGFKLQDRVKVEIVTWALTHLTLFLVIIMGLLTIIRKNRQKEKEMRILFL